MAYCRVSSAGRKAGFGRRAARVVSGANRLGLAVAEVGSGVDGERRKLHRLLSDAQAAVILELVLDAGRRVVRRPAAVCGCVRSTLRGYREAVRLFCDYATDPAYDWASE
ncbi:recombinase family protein [Streptomyces adustus]